MYLSRHARFFVFSSFPSVFLPFLLLFVCMMEHRPEPKNWQARSLFAVLLQLQEPTRSKTHLSCLSCLPDERGGKGGGLLSNKMKGKAGSVSACPQPAPCWPVNTNTKHEVLRQKRSDTSAQTCAQCRNAGSCVNAACFCCYGIGDLCIMLDTGSYKVMNYPNLRS